MIKRETKYIIRRILIGVGIALILGYINACEVKAETQILSPANLSLVNYYGSTTTTITNPNCHNNVCWWNTNLNTTSYRWKAQSTLQYSAINIITFNIEIQDTIRYDNQFPITNVAFGDYSCYYFLNNQSIYTTGGDYIEQYQISAYCPVQGTINLSSGSVTANLTFDNSGSYAFDKVSLSNITFSKDDKLVEIVNNLGALTTALNNINNNINTTNSNLTWILQSANNSAYWNEVNSGKLQNIYDALSSQTTQIITAQNNTTNAVNDMNDTLKNDNVDSPNSSISQMEQNLPTNSVISDLLTLPIRMFQNIVNAIDGTCSPFPLGSLLGTNLVLPCINISNYLGSTLWGAIDVIFSGIFVLSIRKKFIQIFDNLSSLRNGGNELE